jgi:hypothetical protein
MVALSAIMISVYFAVDVSIIFPLIAGLEILAQISPELFIKVDYMKPNHQQLEERLG